MKDNFLQVRRQVSNTNVCTRNQIVVFQKKKHENADFPRHKSVLDTH